MSTSYSKLKAEMVTVKADLSSTLSENYYLGADIDRLEQIISDAFDSEFTTQTTVYSKTVTATAVSRDLQVLGIRKGDMVIVKGMGLFKVEDLTGFEKRKNTAQPVPIVNTIDILHAHVKAAEIFGTGPVEIIWLGSS
jgi:hypothetical protein